MGRVDTAYRAKRAAALGNVVAEATFKTADDQTKPCVTYLKGSGAYDGQGVRVEARGQVIAGTAGNFTAALRQGTTVAGTLLASTGAVAIGGAGNFNWELIFEGVWDAVSKRLRGRMFGHVADTLVSEVINSNPVTGVDASLDNLPFVCTALFGTSNVGNDARLTELLSGTA
jgi:hypothetical protein